ncbi:MAG: hypothetical protein ABSH53_17725 [Holophaga sp.]
MEPVHELVGLGAQGPAHLQAELQPLGGGPDPGQVLDGLEEQLGGEGLDFQGELARLELGEGEDMVDEAQEDQVHRPVLERLDGFAGAPDRGDGLEPVDPVHIAPVQVRHHGIILDQHHPDQPADSLGKRTDGIGNLQQ